MIEKEREGDKGPIPTKKREKEEENKGKQGNPAPLTYPRKESMPGSGPPRFQNGNEESPAHRHKKERRKR